MGIGDDIIATSMAKGAAARGDLVAFGSGGRIIWGPHSKMIFQNNPNVAAPGQERQATRWVAYHKGSRIYNKAAPDRWVWNYSFSVEPGEIFFGRDELVGWDEKLVILEPNLPGKPNSPNKRWLPGRWAEVADILREEGWKVRQFSYGGPVSVAEGIETRTFRQAAAWLRAARLVILPEGGLHHAAAAVGTPAVVLFGGFAPPSVLGYGEHENLTGGAEVACGSFRTCSHCVAAMARITVDQVVESAERALRWQSTRPTSSRISVSSESSSS